MALTFDINIQNDCHGNIVCALEHPGISGNLFWDTVNILGTRRLTGNIHLEHMTYPRNLSANKGFLTCSLPHTFLPRCCVVTDIRIIQASTQNAAINVCRSLSFHSSKPFLFWLCGIIENGITECSVL